MMSYNCEQRKPHRQFKKVQFHLFSIQINIEYKSFNVYYPAFTNKSNIDVK